MRPTARLPWPRRPSPQPAGGAGRRLRAGALVLGVALGLTLQGTVTSTSLATGDTGSTAAAPTVDNLPTALRVSTFNLLGAGHTAPNGDKAGDGWASGPQRMQWAYQLIQRYHLGVVGLQEFEKPQREMFASLNAGQFGVYPAEDQLGDMARRDAIIWRLSQWQLVEAHWLSVPYFHGNPVKMPYVLLRNVQTGREAWFYNTHNPSDSRGPAARWRLQGYRLEWQLVSRLRSQYPGVPVIVTGDKNAKAPYLCPTVRNSVLHSANGSTATRTRCTLHRPARIDWVMGTPDVRYGGYRDIYDAQVRRTSDHHLVFADAQLPSVAAEASPVQHVVVVSVDGLRPWALAGTGRRGSPTLHRMVSRGASTPNARTDYGTVDRLSNVVGMLTGRNANRRTGGHGVWSGRHASTVHRAAGHYVASVFDVLHDLGLRTAVVTDLRETTLVRDSWNATHGAADAMAPWDGRGKISRFVLARSDDGVARHAVNVLRGLRPAFTFVQLSDPGAAGFRYGFGNRRYLAAVRATDARIGDIVAAVDDTSGLAGHTVVVVTAARGGNGHRSHAASRPAYYKVPMFVTGPGVPAGANLYALNPQLAAPGNRRPTYAETRQPIRTAFLANLVTRLLGWPAVPGSDQDPAQTFSVTRPATPGAASTP
ncbi:MAG TPA: alkaline phosphatase family protein [Marmoricola sp.]